MGLSAEGNDPVDGSSRLVWRENERGLHLSLSVSGETYSATGITVQSVLEVMVLELADSLAEREMTAQARPDLMA